MSASEPEDGRGRLAAAPDVGDDGDAPDDEAAGGDPADEPPPEAA